MMSKALKERMDARRPRRLERMRRDSIRQPTGDANRPGAERPAVLKRLSAPVLRFGFRRIVEQQEFDQIGQGSVFFLGETNHRFPQFGSDADIQSDFGHCETPCVVLRWAYGNTTQSLSLPNLP